MITFETEGKGAFTQDEIDRVAVRDSSGNVVSLDLPTKFVMIANHQVCVSKRISLESNFYCFLRCTWTGGTHGVSCTTLASEEYISTYT